MPEVNLRGILSAFAEKNWVVYEAVKLDSAVPPWKHFRGPVDNLQYGVPYRVLPAAENPADLEVAAQELTDMATYGDILPSFKMPEEDVVDVCHFSLAPSQFVMSIGGEEHIISLSEVEGLIRDYFTTYDREYTRKRVERATRNAEEMRERRRRRRKQNDEEYLRSWIDSVTGGQDE